MKLAILLLVVAVVAVNAKRLRKLPGDTPQGRVIGGEDAPDKSAPYQISLQLYTAYNDGYFHNCGGSIIDEHWILTAAHCVDGYTPDRLYVATGSNQWEKPRRRYFADFIKMHPHYNIPDYHNDIALIRVNETIVFDEYTQPVELGSEPLNEGDELVLTGWGSTELWGDAPDNLQMLTVEFLPSDICYKNLGPLLSEDLDTAGNICTYKGPGQAPCHGDSGGPFVHNNKLYGIVNWGLPCANDYPDVQANVAYYNDFIRKTMRGCDW
ncbi:hypothetical protein ACFFRR_002440 [Megaselia abdita]